MFRSKVCPGLSYPSRTYCAAGFLARADLIAPALQLWLWLIPVGIGTYEYGKGRKR
jgi:hypothetical protein